MKYIHYSLAMFLMVGALTSCKQKSGAPAGPMERIIPVGVSTVSEEMIEYSVNYPGTVVALNETELRAEVSGYITNIFVADGAFVSKGQKLYEIDRVRYQAARDQAKAALEITQTNLDKVKRDLDRYLILDEKQAIAKQIVDYARSDYENAKAQVSSAKANLLNAETNLSRSVIYAPFSGMVGISQVRRGALVSAGVTLLNTISATNPIAVDIMVSEKDIQAFDELRKNGKAQRDSIISIELPNGQTYSSFGKVVTIDRAVDQNTGTITVRAAFDNSKGDLRVGMNANLKVRNKVATPQLVIPNKAVMEQLGQTLVYTISDSNTAVPVNVKTGLKFSDKIVVTEGLTSGQKIIVEGIVNLRPHDKITITEPTPVDVQN